MKPIKRCCFCGHSSIFDNNLITKIKGIAEDLILNYDVKEFWVGNYGDFDCYSATAIRELQKTYSNIELNLIIPYLTKKIIENKDIYYKKYNNILMADIPESTPKRFQLIKANEYMIDNSDFLICYIQWSCGGAFTTHEYAKRKKLRIFNIAEQHIK